MVARAKNLILNCIVVAGVGIFRAFDFFEDLLLDEFVLLRERA